MNPLRFDRLDHPLWLLVCALAPQLVWLVLGTFDFLALEAFLSEVQLDAWRQLVLYAGALFAALLILAVGCWLAGRALPGLILGLLMIAAYIFLLLEVVNFDGQLYPFRVPPWVVDQENSIRYPFTFVMPALIYALLLGVEALTPAGRQHSLWRSALAAVVLPITVYALATLTMSLNILGDILPNVSFYVFVVLGISGILFFSFFVFRLLWLLARREREQGKVRSPLLFLLLRAGITILLPLFCLALGQGWIVPDFSTTGILGDFGHPAFFLLALYNGVLLTIPAAALGPRARMVLFAGRLTGLPFSVYFFLVFLPFFPMALPGTVLMGAGVLLLTPTFVLGIHLHSLREDYTALRASRTTLQLAPFAAALLLLPLGVLGVFQYQKIHFRRGFNHVFYPDPRKTGADLELDLAALRAGLRGVRAYKTRGATPYLSRLFYWMALDNLTLPDEKLGQLERIYFGEVQSGAHGPHSGRTRGVGIAAIESTEFGDVSDLSADPTRFLSSLRTEGRTEWNADGTAGYRAHVSAVSWARHGGRPAPARGLVPDYSGRLGGHAFHRFFANWQMHNSGKCANRHAQPPHGSVAAVDVIQASAQPDAHEAAQLVTEKYNAIQRAHISDAVDMGDQSAGQWHRGEPERAHPDREQDHSGGRDWQADEQRRYDGAAGIDASQQVFLGIPFPGPAGRQRAHDIGQADQRDGNCAQGRR